MIFLFHFIQNFNIFDWCIIKSLCEEKVESWAKNCEMPLYYQECRCICVTNTVIFISFILWHGTFNKAKKGLEVREKGFVFLKNKFPKRDIFFRIYRNNHALCTIGEVSRYFQNFRQIIYHENYLFYAYHHNLFWISA